ncbi:maternal protein tudor isoform X2 [Contarinia nasturtii]|uniref:maternal protein tudor isoform X2 n=1 Tax=Contarinia nasturtii TaxID=265458 RepID=UPI0012D397E4|nr:maternal protein tudor isoform X2 [Contarinia nasturtii]
MMEHLTVTSTQPYHGFLEIQGHKRPDLLSQLESEIAAYQPYTKQIVAQPDLHPKLEFDTVYLAWSAGNNKYHRCIVTEKRSNNKVVIQLIDYGSDFEVDASVLLELDPKNKKGEFLREFPPIATRYILANFFCNWKLNERVIIESLLVKSILPITNEQSDRDYTYISLKYGDIDLATKLITSSVGMEISFTEQRMEMRKWSQRFEEFSKGPAMNGAASGSPARREKRRNLVPTRPLQAAVAAATTNNNNNNNTITDQGKQLIQNYIAQKPIRPTFQPDATPIEVIPQPNVDGRIPAFTGNELVPNIFHVVYCSYVENGPNEFYVQLKSQEHILDRLANDLASAERIKLNSKRPINMSCIGMACIARFSEDQNLYRAVIHKVHTDGCRVIFVDYGNSELVAFSDLYEIPSNFLAPKTFAMPFELFGCKELGPIDARLKNAFNALVSNDTLLELKVIPTKLSPVQQCELFLPNGDNVLTVLKQKKTALNTYPNPPHLKDGDLVVIRCAVNAKKFFVQRVKDQEKCEHMMDLLLAHCHSAPKMTVLPPKDKCCAAMFQNDAQEWYRVIVMDQIDNEHVLVYTVDYGFEMKCRSDELRDITSNFLELPRQAIECCLVDFADVPEVPETTRVQIEMSIERSDGYIRKYKTSLHHRLPNSAYVVELRDEENEMSLSHSVYKNTMPRRNNYVQKSSTKAVNEVEKPPRAISTTAIPPVNKPNNWPIVRECDGAESHEKFIETTDGPIEQQRFGNNKDRQTDDNTRYDRAKPQQSPRARIENTKQSMNNGSSPKNYGNRSEFDNRRNNEMNKNKTPDKINTNNNKRPPMITTEDFVGFNAVLPDAIPVPLNSSTKVNIVDWRSPLEFYVQLKSMDNRCDDMMNQIQRYYKKRATIQTKVPIGALVLVRHKADDIIKRAKVLEYNEPRDKYRVQFIDYGSKCICQTSDMYEIEKSFTILPAMAMRCTFGNVTLNKSILEIHDKVHRHIETSNEIECTVIAQEQNIHTVDLIVKRSADLAVNLKNTLIQEKYISNLFKDMSLERLIGQTLTVLITSVTDLTRFQAMLYGCDIALMCSYKDLSLVKKNPQLSEHFRTFENKYVNVKIESIDADNILMLSVYVPGLDQDTNLPDISYYPIDSNTFDGTISHIERPNVVYVQNIKFDGQLNALLDELYGAYESDTSVCSSLEVNQIYVAVSSLDGNYYRCQIEIFYPDDTVTVRWIDYGNTERIPKSTVKVIKEQFKSPLSIMARKMFIPIQFIDENASLADFDWTTVKNVKIVGTHQTNFICDLSLNGCNLFEKLIAEGKAKKLSLSQLIELIDQIQSVIEAPVQEEKDQPIQTESIQHQPQQQQTEQQTEQQQPPPIEKQQEPPKEPTSKSAPETTEISPESGIGSEVSVTSTIPDINHFDSSQAIVVDQIADAPKTEDRELVFITHVDHPNRFYIQLNSDTIEINSFETSLQIVAPQLPALADFRAGQLCIAKYTLDDRWYRAKIIDTDGEITSILFIDYGNTDSITDNTLLKSIIDNSLIERKPYAMKCSLPIAPRGSGEWAENACQKLRMLHSDDSPLTYELVSKDKDVNYVKLFFVGGRDLVKELIQEEVAEPLEIIRSGEKCFISHINSLSDFFIQVDSDSEVLHKIELHLAQNNSPTAPSTPTIGTICSAQFEDGLFYRARILNVLPDGKYDVEFLDYGNTFQTNEIRTLSSEIAQLPLLRRQCTMKMADNIECWSDEAEKKFRDISGDGATEFKVIMSKPGKSAIVELYLDDQNLTDILGELCVKKQPSLLITADEQDGASKEATSPQQHSVNITDFPSGKQTCYLTHIESPNEFYIQFDSKSAELNLIQLQLLNEQDTLTPDDVTVGSVIAALFNDDYRYYRAKVLEKTANDVVVKFIDYGNTCKVTKFRKLSSVIDTIIPLAAQCTLANDRMQQFTEQDTKVFMDFLAESPEPTFQVESIGITTATKTIVTFYRDGMEILDYIRAKVASDVLADVMEQAIHIPH